MSSERYSLLKDIRQFVFADGAVCWTPSFLHTSSAWNVMPGRSSVCGRAAWFHGIYLSIAGIEICD